MDYPVNNKTLAMGIQALAHQGGLIERIDSDKPFLPGAIVMVPKGVWAVLTAEDQAVHLFDEGPHELELMMFNRRPSGILYLVDQAPHKAVWAGPGGENPLAVTLRCTDPKRLVQFTALDRELSDDQDLWNLVFASLAEAVHAQVPAEQARKAFEASLNALGLELIELAAAEKERSTVQIRKRPPKAGPGVPVQATGVLELTHVWTSSTMDLFGKGELTMVVRLRAAPSKDAAGLGQYTYDRTLRFDSPDNWLAADVWQSIPEGALLFDGLGRGWVAVIELTAEERDPHSTDPLGAVTVPIDLEPGTFELAPTKGGKGGHFIRVKGRFQMPPSS